MSDEEMLGRIAQYLKKLQKQVEDGEAKKCTVIRFAKDVSIPKSTLYKNYKSALEEFRSIQNDIGSSSSKKLVLAARRENRKLRKKNEILTAIAHEYFIENESLKLKIQTLKKNKIQRIK